MTTILPEKNKMDLKKVYFLSFVNTFIWLLFLLCLVFLIFQIAIYFFIKIEKEGLAKMLPVSDKDQRSLNINEYREELLKIDNLLNKFSFENDKVGEIINFVYQNKKESISIDLVSVDNREDGEFVTISGFSTNREDLIKFSQSMEKAKNISEFNLPLSSLTKNKEIPYSLTFKYKKDDK